MTIPILGRQNFMGHFRNPRADPDPTTLMNSPVIKAEESSGFCLKDNAYMHFGGRKNSATNMVCNTAHDSLQHIAETVQGNESNTDDGGLGPYDHLMHKATRSVAGEPTNLASHGEVRKGVRPEQRKKKNSKSNDSAPLSRSEKPPKQRRSLLTDAHRRTLHAIWANVSEDGRLYLPSLASRKDWAAAHGLESHIAVSSWFSSAKERAKTIKKKNQKENTLMEEDVVEISKEDAMKEWKLVLEGDGTWKMKHVPMEVLKPTSSKGSSHVGAKSNGVTIKIEENPYPFTDSNHILPSNPLSTPLMPVIDRNADILKNTQCSSQTPTSKSSVLQPIQNQISDETAINTLLDQQMLTSTPSFCPHSESISMMIRASPLTPTLSPAQSVLSPSSTYDVPITPKDHFYAFPQTSGPQIGPVLRSQGRFDGNFYECPPSTGTDRYVDFKDKFSTRFCEYTKTSIPNQGINNAMDLSDLPYVAFLQSPSCLNTSGYNALQSLSGNHYPSLGETQTLHPVKMGTYLQESALKPKDFVRDSVRDTTRLERRLDTGRLGVDQQTFALNHKGFSYGLIPTTTEERQDIENSMYSIQASHDYAIQKPNYVQKFPRFVVQGPRTDVTLVPSPFPELSAIPYLDGVARHSKDFLAAKTKADEERKISGVNENSAQNSDLLNSAVSDVMLIDRLSMLPQWSLDEYFSQWAQDTIEDLELMNKELDLDDMQINIGCKPDAGADRRESDITTDYDSMWLRCS